MTGLLAEFDHLFTLKGIYTYLKSNILIITLCLRFESLSVPIPHL